MFGRSNANFDRLLEKATSQLLLEPDWTSIMQICDSIRQNDTNPKYAVTAIKKKFYHSNPHVALYALQVMESCVKNCGVLMHEEVATKIFMEEMRDLVKQSTDESIKTKVLELLQTWGMAFRNSPKYRIATDTLELMKAEGWKFPPVREAEAMFEADTAPEWADGEVCNRCRVQFTTFTRQHHCRACGQVFCAKCSSKSCVLPKFGIEREVRVCDSCFEEHGPKEGAEVQPVPGGKKASPEPEQGTGKVGGKPDGLPAEYLASPLSKQPQEPPKREGKSEAELKEEEELQLVLALSKSQADEEEKRKKKTTSELMAAYSNTNGTSVPGSQPGKGQPVQQAEPEQPELEKYLNREYWEAQSQARTEQQQFPMPGSGLVAGQADAVMAIKSQLAEERLQGAPTPLEAGGRQTEIDEFTASLRAQLEMFVNRMKSNSSRGRPIANDTSVQTLFMNVMTLHGKLVGLIQEEEDSRVRLEGLQDKMSQVRDATAALEALREEEAERRRLEAEELERQRQVQIQAKLEVMRKKKAEYLEYQRQLAMQRMAEQEREVQKKAEASKAAYMQQYGMYMPPMQQPGYPYQHPGQVMHQQQSMMPPGAVLGPPGPHPGGHQQPQPHMFQHQQLPPEQLLHSQTPQHVMPQQPGQQMPAPQQMQSQGEQPQHHIQGGPDQAPGHMPPQPGQVPHQMAPGPQAPMYAGYPFSHGAPAPPSMPDQALPQPSAAAFNMVGMSAALPTPTPAPAPLPPQDQPLQQEHRPQPGAPEASLICFD